MVSKKKKGGETNPGRDLTSYTQTDKSKTSSQKRAREEIEDPSEEEEQAAILKKALPHNGKATKPKRICFSTS
jgi:hypothetical protein